MARHSSPSPSPSQRTSLGSALSAFGAKISRTLSNDETTLTNRDSDRSQSRGRDVYQSSGRGGAGNIRPASLSSREADIAVVRGREPIPAAVKTFSTGRGGAGNIRSPSRDPTSVPVAIAEEEEAIIRAHITASQDANALHSSGRGGAGNISASRSRSRGPGMHAQAHAPSPPLLGRGRTGNVATEAEQFREEDEHDHGGE